MNGIRGSGFGMRGAMLLVAAVAALGSSADAQVYPQKAVRRDCKTVCQLMVGQGAACCLGRREGHPGEWLFLTAAHTIHPDALASIWDGGGWCVARGIAVDRTKDLALVSIQTPRLLVSAPLATEVPPVGADIELRTWHHSRRPVYRRGPVTAHQITDDPYCFSADIPVEMSNSGGGVFHAGKLVGILVIGRKGPRINDSGYVRPQVICDWLRSIDPPLSGQPGQSRVQSPESRAGRKRDSSLDPGPSTLDPSHPSSLAPVAPAPPEDAASNDAPPPASSEPTSPTEAAPPSESQEESRVESPESRARRKRDSSPSLTLDPGPSTLDPPAPPIRADPGDQAVAAASSSGIDWTGIAINAAILAAGLATGGGTAYLAIARKVAVPVAAKAAGHVIERVRERRSTRRPRREPIGQTPPPPSPPSPPANYVPICQANDVPAEHDHTARGGDSACACRAPFPRRLDEARRLRQLRQREGRIPEFDALVGMVVDDEANLVAERGDDTQKTIVKEFLDRVKARANAIAPPSVEPYLDQAVRT